MYSEKVMEHFRNPRNMGAMEDADGVGEVGNPVCGDMMNIYIKVKDDVLTNVTFKTFGCGAAVATSSMVTELAKGKTIEEALNISKKDVAEALDGLPPIKMHCSNLAADGLKAAILDYLEKNKDARNKRKEMYEALKEKVRMIREKEAEGHDHGDVEKGDAC
jgi:nitrogen fixation NifU-like protein